MDNLWAMSLLGEEGPGLFRLLAPVLTIVAIAVFGWLNEKAKQKERRQQAQEDARREGKDQGRDRRAEPTGQVRPAQAQPEDFPSARRAQRQAGPRAVQPIHRYQPEIPTTGGRGGEFSQAEAEEPELIIMAEDVSDEAAQREFRREQQRLRAEAIRRAQLLQAQRSRKARPKKAKPARRRTLELKPLGEFPSEADFPYTEVFQPSTALLAPGETISPATIRRAILWAEILGAPRGLRPYSDPSGFP